MDEGELKRIQTCIVRGGCSLYSIWLIRDVMYIANSTSVRTSSNDESRMLDATCVRQQINFLTFLAPTDLIKQTTVSNTNRLFITCTFNPPGLNAVCRYQGLKRERIMENLISELALSILKRQAPLAVPERLNVAPNSLIFSQSSSLKNVLLSGLTLPFIQHPWTIRDSHRFTPARLLPTILKWKRSTVEEWPRCLDFLIPYFPTLSHTDATLVRSTDAGMRYKNVADLSYMHLAEKDNDQDSAL